MTRPTYGDAPERFIELAVAYTRDDPAAQLLVNDVKTRRDALLLLLAGIELFGVLLREQNLDERMSELLISYHRDKAGS